MSILHTVRLGRFLRAYRTLRTIAERHKKAGHEVETRFVDEDLMVLKCHTCNAAREADQ